jgi:hypothetical protein
MFQRELSQTLIELIESVQPPEDSGLVVTEAEIDVPLETGSAVQKDRLVFLANVPHSRWKSGFLPPVSMSKIRVVLNEE